MGQTGSNVLFWLFSAVGGGNCGGNSGGTAVVSTAFEKSDPGMENAVVFVRVDVCGH